MLEVDALPAVHQRQRRLTVEMEMPEIAQQPHRGPVADPGQKRIHQHDTVDLGGILGGIGIGDHQPDVVADDPDARQAERGGQRMDVLRHRLLVVAPAGLAESPTPRRSGAITICVLASSAISGRHMWLVCA